MKNVEASVTGSAAAAILAAGLGCLALGLTTTMAEAIPAVNEALVFSTAVGALSGKTTVALIFWIMGWVALDVKWKNAPKDVHKVFLGSLLLIFFGFLGTFPLFFELF